MMRFSAAVVLCAMIGACTTIKIGKDDTSTIVYTGGADVGMNLATRACRKAGQRSAEIISTVNKDPALPAGTGRQVSTFRCSAAEPK